MKFSPAQSLALILTLTAASVLYMCLGVLQLNPVATYTAVTLRIPSSGGLMSTSRVLYNGVEVGEVTALNMSRNGIDARLRIHDDYKIPADSIVEIANLSVVGEQFVNFRGSRSTEGPFLTDGTVILPDRVHVSATVSETLKKLNSVMQQIDPTVLAGINDSMQTILLDREQDLANIGRAAELTTATIEDKKNELTRLYANTQALSVGLAGYGDVLRAAVPDLAALGMPFATFFGQLLPGLATAGDGGRAWFDTIIPFIDKLSWYLNQILPAGAAVATVIRPVTTAIGPSLRLDLNQLIDNALAVLPPDGPARVTIVPK